MSPVAAILLACVAIGVVISLPILLLRRLTPGYKKEQQKSAELKAELDAAFAGYQSQGFEVRSSVSRGKVVAGSVGGVPFEHYTERRTKNGPTYAIVTVQKAVPGEFDVQPKSGFATFAKAVHLVEDFQTGDPRLDDRFFFSGPSVDYLQSVFGDRTSLDHVHAVLEICTEIEKDGNDLSATVENGSFLPVERLTKIVQHLGAWQVPPDVSGAASGLTTKQALSIAGTAGLVLGGIGFAGFYLTKPLLNGAMAFAIGLWPAAGLLVLASLAATYYFLKGHDMPAARGFIKALFFTPLIFAGFLGVLMLANEKLDRSTAQVHEVRLIRAYITTGSKGARYYHFVLTSWRDQPNESLVVDDDVYQLARSNKRAVWEISIREGLLGQAWVESVRPLR